MPQIGTFWTSPMLLRPSTAALIAAGLLLGSTSTWAADLDDNYGYAEAPQELPASQTKVEFGTGWYVRGDIGVTRLPSLGLTAPSSDLNVPTTTFGAGPRVGYDANLGAGYEFNRFFRSDVIADFHQPVKIKQYGNFYSEASNHCQIGQYTDITTASVAKYYEDCSSNYAASIRNYDVLINGYIDLFHWGVVTPYVGAGVGLSFGRTSSGVTYTADDGTPYNTYFTDSGSGIQYHGYRDIVLAQNYYNFAFALMAGVSVDVYAHTKLDIGYRYLNQGKVLGAELASQEVRAGLRYMIDN